MQIDNIGPKLLLVGENALLDGMVVFWPTLTAKGKKEKQLSSSSRSVNRTNLRSFLKISGPSSSGLNLGLGSGLVKDAALCTEPWKGLPFSFTFLLIGSLHLCFLEPRILSPAKDSEPAVITKGNIFSGRNYRTISATPFLLCPGWFSLREHRAITETTGMGLNSCARKL